MPRSSSEVRPSSSAASGPRTSRSNSSAPRISRPAAAEEPAVGPRQEAEKRRALTLHEARALHRKSESRPGSGELAVRGRQVLLLEPPRRAERDLPGRPRASPASLRKRKRRPRPGKCATAIRPEAAAHRGWFWPAAAARSRNPRGFPRRRQQAASPAGSRTCVPPRVRARRGEGDPTRIRFPSRTRKRPAEWRGSRGLRPAVPSAKAPPATRPRRRSAPAPAPLPRRLFHRRTCQRGSRPPARSRPSPPAHGRRRGPAGSRRPLERDEGLDAVGVREEVEERRRTDRRSLRRGSPAGRGRGSRGRRRRRRALVPRGARARPPARAPGRRAGGPRRRKRTSGRPARESPRPPPRSSRHFRRRPIPPASLRRRRRRRDPIRRKRRDAPHRAARRRRGRRRRMRRARGPRARAAPHRRRRSTGGRRGAGCPGKTCRSRRGTCAHRRSGEGPSPLFRAGPGRPPAAGELPRSGARAVRRGPRPPPACPKR